MKTRGFTLIELSIVLVIVGLVVGGILASRELVVVSHVHAQVSQLTRINASVNAFKLKYQCLPGDCAKATQLFTAGAQPEQVQNGNGDGLITGYMDSTYLTTSAEENGAWLPWTLSTAEYSNVFDHLAAAGMFPLAQYDETDAASSNRPGRGYPRMAIESAGSGATTSGPGGVLVGWEPSLSYVPAGHKIRLGACRAGEIYGWPATALGFPCGLNPWEAEPLDRKVDDGRPLSGRMVVTYESYIYRVPGAPWASALTGGCALNNSLTDNAYVNEASGLFRECAVSIVADF